MSHPVLWAAAVAACFFATGPATAVTRPKSGDGGSPHQIPGGVADAEGNTGYLANPAGGLDAVDLAKGKLLWAPRGASRPLALDGNRLVCRADVKGKANSIRLVVLAVNQKGKRLLE